MFWLLDCIVYHIVERNSDFGGAVFEAMRKLYDEFTCRLLPQKRKGEGNYDGRFGLSLDTYHKCANMETTNDTIDNTRQN